MRKLIEATTAMMNNKKIKDSKISVFILLALIGLTIVLFLDLMDQEFSMHDILVESHGLVFDLLVFGVLITTYESIKSKQDTIIRYREEIEDYAFWDSDEAKYRIRGIVKRLIDLNAKKIDLSHCSVKSCPWTKDMKEWKFVNSKLFNSFFICSNLSRSNFYLSELYDSNFSKADLTECDFRMTIFNNCNFIDCNLNKAIFDFSYVQEQNWFDILQSNKNEGVDFIISTYIISSNTISMNSNDYYQVINKSQNTSLAIDRDKLIRDNIINYQPKIKLFP